jgi:putative endonuclease
MLIEAWVYIMASRSRCLYIGVTRDLPRRWVAHQQGHGSEFVRKYHVHRLVYVERCDRLVDAIRREKQLKGWLRRRKLELIEHANPGWEDLADGWGWTIPR